MATPGRNYNAVSMDQPITIKIAVNDSVKKLKLPLRDLGAKVLPDKVRPAGEAAAWPEMLARGSICSSSSSYDCYCFSYGCDRDRRRRRRCRRGRC